MLWLLRSEGDIYNKEIKECPCVQLSPKLVLQRLEIQDFRAFLETVAQHERCGFQEVVIDPRMGRLFICFLQKISVSLGVFASIRAMEQQSHLSIPVYKKWWVLCRCVTHETDEPDRSVFPQAPKSTMWPAVKPLTLLTFFQQHIQPNVTGGLLLFELPAGFCTFEEERTYLLLELRPLSDDDKTCQPNPGAEETPRVWVRNLGVCVLWQKMFLWNMDEIIVII